MPLDLHASVDDAGIELIQYFEGLKDGDTRTPNLDPYLCPADYWTIGWGHVVLGPDGTMLKGRHNHALAYSMFPGGITHDQAVKLLHGDLVKYENGVMRAVGAEAMADDTTQSEMNSMTALCFNIGIGNFAPSSVARFHKQGLRWSDASDAKVRAILAGQASPDNAADAFLLWTKATVDGERVQLEGLVRRRLAEREMYLRDN